MAPVEAPSRRRRALLIASGRYSDPGLASLRAPTGDVEALATVLGDDEIGAFEIEQLVDQPTDAVKKRIEDFFRDNGRNDLLLLYFSGHGVLAQDRRFYFATASTELRWVRTTAIDDRFVNEAMDHSRARSIVVVLDCCHSGAFGKGLVPKSALTADVEHRFDGHGRVTLTASNELEYAFEETDPATSINELEPAEPGSLFTRCLVEGLSSGEADTDADGAVSVDDLYDYVKQRVRERSTHQTPRMSGEVSGDIVIARSSRRPALPADLAAAADSSLAGVRAGAVAELAALMKSGPPPSAAAAREALQRLAGDDSRSVSAAAQEALGRPSPPPKPPPPKPPPPKPKPKPDRARWKWPAIAAAGVAAAAVGAVLLLGGGEEPKAVATPYDFDGDRSQEIVLGAANGSPSAGARRAGSVVVHNGEGEARLVSATEARVPGPHRAGDRFGAALASGDFDDDGHADLAIGVPGRDLVSVLYGSGSAEAERVTLLPAGRLPQRPDVSAFGFSLVAADFDRNGFADLAVGTPGSPAEREEGEPGAVHLLLGGPGGLTVARSRRLDTPPDYRAGFGRFLAAGDVDRDGAVDLVGGTMAEPDLAVYGNASLCPGARDGPRTCELLGDGGYGTSALAVADVNGDHIADIVQADKAPWDSRPPDESEYLPAEIRLWLGSPRGPAESPLVLEAGAPEIPIPEEEGDELGHAVQAGDVDGDGLADIVVGARYHGEAGAVVVIRGSGDGFARSGNFALEHDPEEGEGFGEALSLLDVDGDRRLDVVAAVETVTSADQAVVTFVNSPGGLGQETPVRGLEDLVTLERTPLRIGN